MDVDKIMRHRRTERRHMIAAKDALKAGLAQSDEGHPPSFDFYAACIAYLEFSLGRFHVQGRANTGRLEPLIREDDEREQTILSDIKAVIDTSELEVGDLVGAFAHFQEQGPSGRERFENDARQYIEFYESCFATRKDPAQKIIERHFKPGEYATLTNDFTQSSLETEAAFFKAMQETAPEGLAPPDEPAQDETPVV